MTDADGSHATRPDPISFTGFIAHTLQKGAVKGGVRGAEKLLQDYDEKEIRKAAEDMPAKVRTAVLKVITQRQTG